jgi:hypothetical protein
MWRRFHLAAAATLVIMSAARANAHHEALFGPQSALALSGAKYFTAQVFTRQTGPREQRVQETTTVLSVGVTPSRRPISISVVVPFSVIASHASGRRVGIENAIVAARYRFDAPGLAQTFRTEESYFMAIGGIELPTGTIDHGFGEGAPAVVAAGTFSVERRPFSAIGYGFVHRYAERDLLRESGNRFVGAGLAWTPLDDEPRGRLFSLQLGVSHETTFREHFDGAPREGTGGWALVAHSTVVVAVSPHVLVYGLTSLPLADAWNDPADRERLRIGAGAMITLGQ